MGQCTGKTAKKLTYKCTQQYWRQPTGTEKLANISLPKLQFQGTLANFKIINCQYPNISVKVEIKGVDTFLLRTKSVKSDKSANWSFKHKFQFEMTQFELRKSFIQIFLFDQTGVALGQLKVNLYLVCTGPYHQNFSVRLKKGENTRIYFDLKISQIIQVKLDSIKVEIDPFTKHPGEKFNYSLKAIVGHNTALNVSAPSYTVKVNLDDKQNSENSLKSVMMPALKRKSTIKSAQKQIPEGHNLVWTKEDHLPMPSIVLKTLASELHQCYFQLLFWKIYDKNETQTQKGQQIPQIFGQCYVALHKIFDIESSIIENSNQTKERRTFTSEDKLWNHGKEIGKGFFEFEVINDKYIKQMQVMVRTEEGIMKYSPVFFTSNQNSKNPSSCQQLIELTKISQEIQFNAVQLDRVMTQESHEPNLQIRKIKVSIEKLLERILTLLEKSVKNNVILYSYSSAQEMMRAQQIFLGLGFKILNYLEEEDAHIIDLCWEILVALLERGEFLLAHIGFDQRQKTKINEGKTDSKLQMKIQIALTYHEFLGKLLKIAVDSLNLQGLELERNFAEVFCAYAYFRIPDFRTAFLQTITRSNDPELPQWRSIQFSLQDDIDYDELKQEVNTFTALFDWSNNFHKCLQHLEKYQIDSGEVREVLMREDWKYRMSKRGITFFQFIKCWVEYIESVVTKPKDIQWKYFPGYNRLLKCFLIEMKKRPILQYPDILKISLFKLLANEKILNPIIYILFNKANIYEPLTVIRAIVFISEIFTVLCQKDKKIPATFNYFHFYQGIKIILQSEFSFAISKTIVMLYNYYKIFNLQFKRNISMFLLGKVFFRLFLHWSFNVRDVFYHLVMRLYHQTLRMNPECINDPNLCQQEVNQQIRGRYIKLIDILGNLLYMRQEEKKGQNFEQMEKQLYKRLKNKMNLTRRSKGKQKNILNGNGNFSLEKNFSNGYVSRSLTFEQPKAESTKFLNSILSPTQSSRMHSQTQRSILKMQHKNSKSQKQQQIKVLNKKTTLNFKHKIYDNTQGHKMEMKSSINDQYGPYDQTDFQIGKIEPQLLEYIEAAMKQFKKTNELFTNNFNNKQWELPKIQMEMSLDSKQIRPQKIDDW